LILGFDRNVDEICTLLGYYTASCGKQLQISKCTRTAGRLDYGTPSHPVKIQVTAEFLELAMKAQRGSRGIALLFP
jgi:hypothetical protein